MKKRTFETEHFMIEESLVDTSGDAIWSITEKENNSYFYIHVSATGQLYITFFKNTKVKNPIEAIEFICKDIIAKNLIPTIKIHYTNTCLISLCRKVGFRKVKDQKHLYVYKKAAQ